jgi:hypothetical protein
MTTDERVAAGLHELQSELDGPPPARLLNAIREQAPEVRARHAARVRARVGVGATLLAVLVAGAFTSPGRAATEWVANLAGIGDEPTLDFPGDEPGAVVIGAGHLSDGTPYEVVARVIDPATRLSEARPNQIIDEVEPSEAPPLREARGPGRPSVCFGIDLPTRPKADQDSFCAGQHAGGGEPGPFTTYGAFPEVRSGPAIIFGVVEDPAVADVRIVDGPTAGEPAIPSSLLSVDQSVLDIAGREDPVWFFVSPVDESLVAAANRGELDLYAAGFDDAGNELSRVPVLGPASESQGIGRRIPSVRELLRSMSRGPAGTDSDEVQRVGGDPYRP